jgi:hypothetical protein
MQITTQCQAAIATPSWGTLNEHRKIGLVYIIVIHCGLVVLEAEDHNPVAEILREGCNFELGLLVVIYATDKKYVRGASEVSSCSK